MAKERSLATRPLLAMAGALLVFASSAGAAEKPWAGFVPTNWHERGAEHGTPKHNSRFRVNAPEANFGPKPR